MKTLLTKHAVFIGKSLLWSVLLYTAIVLTMDWEELRGKMKNEARIVRVVKDDGDRSIKSTIGFYKAAKIIWLQLSRSH